MKRYLLPAAAILFACGCEPQTHGTLSGKVTLNGQPVPSGSIRFTPIDGNSSSASCLIRDGSYQAKIPVNTHRVVISSPQVVGGKPGSNPTTDDGVQVKQAIPKQYNDASTLTVTVEPGKTEYDFDLKN